MKLPNKLFTTYESCIGTFPVILKIVKEKPVTIFTLYEKTQYHFPSVTDFIDTLDSLFYLGKIEFNKDTKELTYVD